MKRIISMAGWVAIIAAVPLWSQTTASTSGWERSHPKNLTEGGPAYILGSISWKENGGGGGTGQCRNILTPDEQIWGEDFADAHKALARMRRIETMQPHADFEFDYVMISGQSLRVGCRKVGVQNWGAFHVFLDRYEPGKGYRIFRNGTLIHEEFFDPHPTQPRIDFKEINPDRVEWKIQRAPKFEMYHVRVSWDGGETWFVSGFKDNHVVLNLEESRRKPGVQPWIDFQIAQGFVVTTHRYVIGKGLVSVK